MTDAWTADELNRFAAADELHIAVRRTDGTLRRRVPIWVVVVGDDVFVRTWFRRDTGWFGQAVSSGRAAVDVPGLAADVRLVDVGAGPDRLRAGVDAAYRTKYARYGASAVGPMVADAAAATTLRLTRENGVDSLR